MPHYLRPRRSGACLFLTITLARRGARDLVEHIDILRDAVRRTRADRPFAIDAWVVLPDHMHCVWTLPENDCDFSTRVGLIKARFSRRLPMGQRRASHVFRRERGIWQRRFWEHHIRDETDYRNHVAYCWHNPVKHGYVARPEDWPHSSWHRDHASAART
ncbi:REP-associated tyrosine transposase [Sulfitobacter sp. S190]|uniref:REP-associated tyrosine transposase n=1 Tax=Sulfitobacter sp. S190 TaxID=2867022 RepID=UPI0021A3BF3E|nr:transposase [Sulfitobacter sp. S190]UWR21473.1 transposase [Sulfitobacter sp. S190]